MKRSAGKIFISKFIKSFFIVALLLSAGILSYRTSVHYWKVPENETVVAYKEQPAELRITEASIDDISKNLIYCYDKESNKIEKMVLEIFHCKNKKITYITIPMRTQFAISSTLYRDLTLVNPEIPQIMKLSTIAKYLESDIVFDYGVLILEDILEFDISYYTVIPKENYDGMFTESYLKDEEGDTAIEGTADGQPTAAEVFSKDYKKKLKTLDTQEAIKNYLEEIYPSLQSNLDLNGKMNYLDSYSETTMDHISFEIIRGNNKNSAYEINYSLAAQQLNELITGQ